MPPPPGEQPPPAAGGSGGGTAGIAPAFCTGAREWRGAGPLQGTVAPSDAACPFRTGRGCRCTSVRAARWHRRDLHAEHPLPRSATISRCRSAPEIKAPTIDAQGFLAPELQGVPPPKQASCMGPICRWLLEPNCPPLSLPPPPPHLLPRLPSRQQNAQQSCASIISTRHLMCAAQNASRRTSRSTPCHPCIVQRQLTDRPRAPPSSLPSSAGGPGHLRRRCRVRLLPAGEPRSQPGPDCAHAGRPARLFRAAAGDKGKGCVCVRMGGWVGGQTGGRLPLGMASVLADALPKEALAQDGEGAGRRTSASGSTANPADVPRLSCPCPLPPLVQ